MDKPVVLDVDNVLVNNYLRYLAAKQMGYIEVPFVTQGQKKTKHTEPVSYIVGKFKEDGKKYIWKNDKGIPVSVGDLALVNSKTKKGKCKVIVRVVDVFYSTKEKDLKHKSMIKNLSYKEK